MKITPGFNPEKGEIIFFIETNLLIKYYPNLKGMLDRPGLPENLSIRKTGTNTAEISFSLNKTNHSIKEKEEGMSTIAVDDSSGHISNLHKTINNFVKAALKKEFKTNEFIPLKGYPKEDIVKDTKTAYENKRNLCLIKNYDEYLSTQNTQAKPSYNQYILEYGTDEWADAILEIMSPSFDLKKFTQKYKSKLKLTDWI